MSLLRTSSNLSLQFLCEEIFNANNNQIKQTGPAGVRGGGRGCFIKAKKSFQLTIINFEERNFL